MMSPFEYMRRVAQGVEERVDGDVYRWILNDLFTVSLIEGGYNAGRDVHLTCELVVERARRCLNLH